VDKLKVTVELRGVGRGNARAGVLLFNYTDGIDGIPGPQVMDRIREEIELVAKQYREAQCTLYETLTEEE
jgi:hypothetical protein